MVVGAAHARNLRANVHITTKLYLILNIVQKKTENRCYVGIM